MKKILLLLVLVFAGLCSFASDKIPVTLSRVYDGDTIEVINETNQKESIRLLGIDWGIDNNSMQPSFIML